MTNTTREKKIEIIRNVMNNNDYIELLSNEQIDELYEISTAPIKEKVTAIYERVKNLVETIIKNTSGR